MVKWKLIRVSDVTRKILQIEKQKKGLNNYDQVIRLLLNKKPLATNPAYDRTSLKGINKNPNENLSNEKKNLVKLMESVTGSLENTKTKTVLNDLKELVSK